MTQIVNPSIDRVADSFLTAGSLAYAGLRDGGIVPSGQQTQLAEQSAADETVLNGFAFSTSGLDVTVSAGEAFVFGSWIIKDTQTTVTLPASSTTKVYVGWNKDAANSVIIGRDSDFDDEDSKIEVGEFTTDSSTVTSESDLREFVSIDAERLEGKDTSEITPDISDDGATVVENVDDINVERFSASNDGDGSATIVGVAQYTDSDAIGAVNNESSLSVNISGDANTVDGFSFVKDGNSGPGIINYQTGIEATGGTTVIDRTINGVDYRIHAFENVGSSTFSVNQAPSDATVDVLVVGGGGGTNGDDGSGGAGAGGLAYIKNYPISQGNKNVEVGNGGPARSGDRQTPGFSGDDSLFNNDIRGLGGGGGGDKESTTIPSGGSTGGKGQNNSISSKNASQPGTNSNVSGTVIHDAGNKGEQNHGTGDFGGGGGGAGEDAKDITRGGDGIDMSSEFGTQFGENGFFAGGGGGSENDGTRSNPASGGLGGGGDGGEGGSGNDGPQGDNGLENTGGGAGGCAGDGSGASGGSGIVLIRYEI